MSVRTLSRSPATPVIAKPEPASPAGIMPVGALWNRYTLISAAGVVAAFASGNWRAALVIFALTFFFLLYMIGRAIARA
jgi:hypothetical protein